MITGHVNRSREAVITLLLRDNQGQEVVTDGIVDTGFNGYLSLPPSQIRSLGLTPAGQTRGILADGTPVLLDLFRIYLLWDGTLAFVDVNSIDGAPLIGMALLEGFDLRSRAIAGGEVVIERIPSTP